MAVLLDVQRRGDQTRALSGETHFPLQISPSSWPLVCRCFDECPCKNEVIFVTPFGQTAFGQFLVFLCFGQIFCCCCCCCLCVFKIFGPLPSNQHLAHPPTNRLGPILGQKTKKKRKNEKNQQSTTRVGETPTWALRVNLGEEGYAYTAQAWRLFPVPWRRDAAIVFRRRLAGQAREPDWHGSQSQAAKRCT